MKSIKRITAVVFLFSIILWGSQAMASDDETLNTVAETEVDFNSGSETVQERAVAKPNITYSMHMQRLGWLDSSSNSAVNGSPGEGLRAEAFIINETGMSDLNVNYRAYVAGSGWSSWATDGNIAGTTGQSKPVTILQVSLIGSQAQNYDIYYCVYTTGYGWLDWAKNGTNAGTAPEIACNIEAVRIKIVRKGEAAPGDTNNSYLDKVNVYYYSHMQSIGDTVLVSNGLVSGLTGLNKRMEGLYVYTDTQDLSIKYRGHIEKKGWGDYVYDGSLCGTIGESLRVEAFQMFLVGDKSKYYDIYYRVYSESYGWLGWAMNGAPAGTCGYGKLIEAVQIMIIPKVQSAPGNTEKPFISCSLVQYSAHVESYGWQNWIKDSGAAGTMGEAKRIEAVKISLSFPQADSGIKYRTYIQSYGWQDWVCDGEISGTTGIAKRVEAIEIKLTGEYSKMYDLYYRTYTQSYGWLGWAKDGETSGTTGLAKRMEAIEIVVVDKRSPAPGTTGGNYVTAGKIGIDVSKYNGNVDWAAVKATGIVNFAMIRCGNRDSQTGVIIEDPKFKNNIEGAIKNNIPVGIYFYSQAITKEEAIEEANWVISKINKYKITYPVVFDFEHIGENRVANLSYSARNNIAVAFLDRIKAAGYHPMMYASQSGYSSKWNADVFVKNYDIWVARYRSTDDISTSDRIIAEVRKGFNGTPYSLERADMWQFTSKGRISGISGDVDINICYKDY